MPEILKNRHPFSNRNLTYHTCHSLEVGTARYVLSSSLCIVLQIVLYIENIILGEETVVGNRPSGVVAVD